MYRLEDGNLIISKSDMTNKSSKNQYEKGGDKNRNEYNENQVFKNPMDEMMVID